jgi:hypothetical protein
VLFPAYRMWIRDNRPEEATRAPGDPRGFIRRCAQPPLSWTVRGPAVAVAATLVAAPLSLFVLLS